MGIQHLDRLNRKVTKTHEEGAGTSQLYLLDLEAYIMGSQCARFYEGPLFGPKSAFRHTTETVFADYELHGIGKRKAPTARACSLSIIMTSTRALCIEISMACSRNFYLYASQLSNPTKLPKDQGFLRQLSCAIMQIDGGKSLGFSFWFTPRQRIL